MTSAIGNEPWFQLFFKFVGGSDACTRTNAAHMSEHMRSWSGEEHESQQASMNTGSDMSGAKVESLKSI